MTKSSINDIIYSSRRERRQTKTKSTQKIEKFLKNPLTKSKIYDIIKSQTKGSDQPPERETKMTKRDFFKAIENGEVTEDIKAFATAELAKMDAENEKRRNTKSKDQLANDEIKVKILDFIGMSQKVSSEIGTGLGISTAKASALCGQLVAEGKLVAAEVKSGKAKVKAYSTPSEE